MIDIVNDPIDLQSWISWARTDADGAVVSFVGTVRDHSDGRRVIGMEYHCYRELALKELSALEGDVRRRWSVGRIAIIHRIGPMSLGETSVAIVVASPHRADAFEACRYAIDTLKETIPIWKKEQFADETAAWVRGVIGRPVAGSEER